MPALVAGAASVLVVIHGAANVACDGWCGAEAAVRADTFSAAFFVDQDNHPDTHSTGVAQERRAVNPPGTSLALAILVWTCKPTNLCSDTTTLTQCCS